MLQSIDYTQGGWGPQEHSWARSSRVPLPSTLGLPLGLLLVTLSLIMVSKLRTLRWEDSLFLVGMQHYLF